MAIGAFRELVSMGWLLAALPPGAFFSLALAIAAKNALDRRRHEKRRDALPRRSRLINR
jgi:Na+-translocating ferredoxin:NAD+ oxidoreductase RnfE subunit